MNALDQISKLMVIIKELIVNGFYGSLLVKFENGKVVHIKKEESIKID